jgi:hypothetical protein
VETQVSLGGDALGIRASGVNTALFTVHGELPDEVVRRLDQFKLLAQATEDDVPTSYTFVGQTLYCKPHGSQRHWRWILHCPNLHLNLGRGKYNHVIGLARLSSAFLWEQGFDVAQMLLYAFVHDLLGGTAFALHISELHLCADIEGWELNLEDAHRFVTRCHNFTPRLMGEDEETGDEAGDDATGGAFVFPAMDARMGGRRCRGFDFSRGAAHSCCLYDKTAEIVRSRKDWMRLIWQQHSWQGGRVYRVEFRYKRECLREMGIGDALAFLEAERLASLWAYSSLEWLRHTCPMPDTNKARWPISPTWAVVQGATFDGEGVPAVRERRIQGDLQLICQMLAGCSTTAAAYLAGTLPASDDGANFLGWFDGWMQEYLQEKGVTFQQVREGKRLRFGMVSTPCHLDVTG